MATVNLGRIKPVFRGAYNNSTAYVIDDIVTSGGETFIAIAATTGNATSDASKWTKLAAKGSDGVDGTDVAATLANKEIAFKTNAGALDGIPIGTAGQALKVNSGATGYEFGTAGGILQLKTAIKTNTQSISSNWPSFADVSGLSVDITPSSTSNKILVGVYINTDATSGYRSGAQIIRTVSGGSATQIGGSTDLGNRTNVTFGTGKGDPNGLYAFAYQLLDAPNTTSAVNYKVRLGTESSGGTVQVNKDNNDSNDNTHQRSSSTITVMEIASGIL